MSEANQEYINFCKPFIDSISDIYKKMMSTELRAERPTQISSDFKELYDMSVIIEMEGVLKSDSKEKDFKGQLVISWKKDSYIKTSSAMLMEEFTEINDEIADVGLEICNITVGNAKSILNSSGYFIEMSIPKKLDDTKSFKLLDTSTIMTPFESNLGDFFIVLNYLETNS